MVEGTSRWVWVAVTGLASWMRFFGVVMFLEGETILIDVGRDTAKRLEEVR